DPEGAEQFIRDHNGHLAVKPIGLTGGKGVRITGEHFDKEGAIAYVHRLGGNVVLEERMEGEEFTLQAFVDGTHIVPMPLVQDHKRAYEGDRGPNTGGMGSYSMPDQRLPFVSESDYRRALQIMKDAVSALGKNGYPFRGILYGQFMNTRKGPMVIEFNARFGDPEAMNVLSILKSSFVEILCHILAGTLSQKDALFEKKATVCKYIVPEGYPEAPLANEPLGIGDYTPALLYYANAEGKGESLFTQTSRTLAFVGVGDTLEEAESIAEKAASSVKGKVFHRRDIGKRALLESRCAHMRELK
ncbi:MAG TPA: phosphoribosylamine--glycine ligase, partial [Methanomicrobiales archaeon]|nr:phosphoribosylamine--glycine ligase [Methanomicrobiales archaeon]